MLWGVNTFLGYLQTYRTLWLKSRYGSGKTALAFRLAYELHERGAVRYIISNCASPWVDRIEDVVLRDGRWVDACLIMDEAGMFMAQSSKAVKYISYLRKLNIILLLPSVQKPASIVRDLSVKRLYNLQVAGIPAWMYTYRLLDGEDKTNDNFYWWRPSEIFGLYDTAGFPSDDAGIEEAILFWTQQAANKAGYEIKSLPGYFGAGGGVRIEHETVNDEQSLMVETMRGFAENIEEQAAKNDDAISILISQGRKKRGR